MVFPVKLLLFASLRDNLKEESSIDITLDKKEWSGDEELKKILLNELKRRWAERNPKSTSVELPPARTLMLAVNEDYVSPYENIKISAGDNIALIPPVSGG